MGHTGIKCYRLGIKNNTPKRHVDLQFENKYSENYKISLVYTIL